MACRLLALRLDARDPRRAAAFWGALLDRAPVDDASGVLLRGGDTQVSLRFVPGRPRTGPHRVHLHVTSSSPADQERTVERALRLGATPLDVGQRPEEAHVVLADAEGDEFCVTGPGSTFLAGCGPLGELACDGTREVGLFWASALDWPLVWDEDGETAVQHPRGGTKVAWGGPPVAMRSGPDGRRFELGVTGGDLDAEVDRLVALGATVRDGDGAGEAVVVLVDPDGGEFSLAAGPAS
ncbi:VOC family protein [Kineococcus rubinsiae]|uniref:VOC family protein n=1 Tax=Kineococcus rubinsiae TaxID=2609562 RepID=UPI001431CA7E|nr:VOC family protein [Kineococcus rubinsiae]NIZ92109.1 VOC family protein [Kineococcus rubinsiae]